MARSLQNKPQVEAPSARYPEGRIKDDDGSGTTGTPVNEDVYGDMHQFFARLMVEAGITPNEIADNAYDGFQLLESLIKLTGDSRKHRFNLGAWNMNTTPTIKIDLTGITTWDKVIRISVWIKSDDLSTGFQTDLVMGNTNSNTMQGNAYVANDGILGSNEIVINRKTGGDYDGAGYSSTAINRGYALIEYLP